MKERIKKFIKLIKKYLLDILIITGVLILSYNVLRPVEKKGGIMILGYTDYHTEEKVFGIFLIAIGIDLAIRKYLSSKNERKS